VATKLSKENEDEAGGLCRRRHLYETHAAITRHREGLVVAEARDVDPSLLASL